MQTFRTTHHRFDMVICDVDGCLCPESASPMDVLSLGKIADHNRHSVENRDRPILTLCSGRPQPFAEAMCRLLQNTVVPCIAENGVWMYVPGENLYLIDPAITREHRAAVREAAAWLEETYGGKGVSQQPGKSASVSLYHPDTEYLRSIAPEVGAHFERRGWPMRVSMTWLYINCDLTHVSKATGLDRLFGYTGIPRARCAGIGDTMSDKSIADRVAFFACPANAGEEIRGLARYTSAFAEAAGVVDILEQLTM